MKKIESKIARSWSDRPLELLTGLFTAAWGLWVLNPFMDSFTYNQVYSLMKNLFPELTWGIIFSTIGLLSLLLTVFERTNLRILVIEIQVFGFITLSVFSLIGNITSTAGIMYSVVSLCGILAHNSILLDIKTKEIADG